MSDTNDNLIEDSSVCPNKFNQTKPTTKDHNPQPAVERLGTEDEALLVRFTDWVSEMPNRVCVFSNGIAVVVGEKGDMCVMSLKKVYYEGGILGLLSSGFLSVRDAAETGFLSVWEMLRELIAGMWGRVTSVFSPSTKVEEASTTVKEQEAS